MKKVDSNKKMDFIRWFIQHHHPKRVECAWLLNYIGNSPNLLERTYFVSDARNYDRSILISARGTNSPSFIFRMNEVISYSVENTYAEIKAAEHVPVYIEINFPGCHYSDEYLEIVEDDLKKAFLSVAEKEEVEMLLERVNRYYEKMSLLKEIDKSLDEKDREAFISLTEKLKTYDF